MAMVQVEDQLAAAETGTASPATGDKAKIRNALSLTPVSGGDLSMVCLITKHVLTSETC